MPQTSEKIHTWISHTPSPPCLVGLNRMQHQIFLLVLIGACCCKGCLGSSNLTTTPPERIKIGALLAFNTTIGNLAKQAIQLAVQDVNNALDLLNGTKLELEMFDSGCTPVQGAASAVELVKRGVMTIVGPQSSAVAQFAAHIGKQTRVPFVSFGATDPNLSEMQYPYFIRVVPSDRLQMEAVAAFIANFRWKEVVMFHMDDDYGTNGASRLSDSLQARGSKLVEKVALDPWAVKADIDTQLKRLSNMQTRVFVVHTHLDMGYLILQEAYFQNMLESGYVWIVTDLIANNLTELQLDPKTVKYTQGVIGIHRYVPQSSQLEAFLAEWGKISPTRSPSLEPSLINTYALYAYDAVWTVARALASYLDDKQGDAFQEPTKLPAQSGGESELAQMKIFEGGAKLRDIIIGTTFVGASGRIKFDATGDLVGAAFEYINMVSRNAHVVGYWWTNGPGVSSTPPLSQEFSASLVTSDDETFLSSTTTNVTMAIIWPGKVTDAPRGWVLPNSGKRLKIGVPLKAGYKQIVGVANGTTNQTSVTGFCIDVFESALKYLPYAVPYEYELIGDGVTTPTYSDLVSKLAHQDYDALVGDVSILAERLKIVDLTQPYIESGLVVLVPVKDKRENNPWAFLRPFTSIMWITVLLSFLFTGTVIWILEHKVNKDFRGSPKTQFITVVTFIFSTLFFSQKEETRSFLGRIVLLIWLFVILIINSSYTASLTSILTVQQLTPSIQGLDSLLQTNVPIGYQTGSFVQDYLKNLNVSPARLKPFNSREASIQALADGPNKGGVAAIVDELPYIQLLQALDCNKYTIAGQEFTKSGWGFAFPLGSEITADVSQAILSMSQTGELERIRTFWFKELACADSSSTDAQAQSSQLDFLNFWGLFLISGVASVLCVFIHVFILFRNYRKQHQVEGSAITRTTQFSEHFKQFIVYADKAKSKEKKPQQNLDVFKDQSVSSDTSASFSSASSMPRKV